MVAVHRLSIVPIFITSDVWFFFVHVERLERSPEEGEYTLNFEESVMSSHTATDDEIDFRMILPSESHRRRSLGKTGRSGSIGSDQGTVSYSSVSYLTRSQTREICEKQEKYFERKVAIFTVQSVILKQYPVDLLTYMELYWKSSRYFKMGKFGLDSGGHFVRVRSI